MIELGPKSAVELDANGKKLKLTRAELKSKRAEVLAFLRAVKP